MNSKLIFISSPYTHENPEVVHENYLKVAKFAAELIKQGYVAFSPILYGHNAVRYQPDMPTDWDFWKIFCLTFLSRSDEMIVYMMEGWDKSKGVKEEIQYAKDLGIEIIYREYEAK
jgi:hypothetical protein